MLATAKPHPSPLGVAFALRQQPLVCHICSAQAKTVEPPVIRSISHKQSAQESSAVARKNQLAMRALVSISVHHSKQPVVVLLFKLALRPKGARGPEGSHIEGQEFQFRAQVTIADPCISSSSEILCEHICMLHSGLPQTITKLPLHRRNFTDGINRRIGRPKLPIDFHTATAANLEPALPRQLVSGSNSTCKHQNVKCQNPGFAAALLNSEANECPSIVQDLQDAHRVVHRDAHRRDLGMQHRRCLFVELLVHEKRAPLKDARLQRQIRKCLGGFQAKEPSTDHGCCSGPARCRAKDAVDILDGAVREDTRQAGTVAGDGRHDAIAAGRKHQDIIRHLLYGAGLPPRSERHGLGRPVDRSHLAVDQLDAGPAEHVLASQGQPLPRAMSKVGRQHHAIVSGLLLGTEYCDG
mmetsp:Transcript_137216/g.437795  ORF Transcript_137216/g.437795 Transcript_137216/m.437795 type:complete len:411 (-) Transcript_137216:552-1784(-)